MATGPLSPAPRDRTGAAAVPKAWGAAAFQGALEGQWGCAGLTAEESSSPTSMDCEPCTWGRSRPLRVCLCVQDICQLASDRWPILSTALCAGLSASLFPE